MTSIGPTTMSAIADAVAQPIPQPKRGIWYQGKTTASGSRYSKRGWQRRPGHYRRGAGLGAVRAGEAMRMTRGMAGAIRRASRKRKPSSANAPKQIDTGMRDAKDRIIWRGPRGGMFVRGKNNRKLKPATGGRSRIRSGSRSGSRY